MLVLIDSESPIFTKSMCQERERESKKEGDMALLYILINKIDEWYSWILEPVKKEGIQGIDLNWKKQKEKEKSIDR